MARVKCGGVENRLGPCVLNVPLMDSRYQEGGEMRETDKKREKDLADFDLLTLCE